MDINAAIVDWLVGVFQELGDPQASQDRAQAFAEHAAQLREIHASLADQVDSVAWTGDATRAHAAVWQQHAALADEAVANLESAHEQLSTHAQKAWAIVKEVLGVALEILELLAAGALLTWLTAGLSDLIWIRAAPLVGRILDLLADYRMLLSEFAEGMREYGSVAGRIGETIETLLVDYTPAYMRAYTGFFISAGVPQLMSGRPVDWGGNAWQVALFVGFDGSLNLIESALEKTTAGAAVKDVIIGGGDRVGTLGRDGRAATADISSAEDGLSLRGDAAMEPRLDVSEERPRLADLSEAPPRLPDLPELEPIDGGKIFADAQSTAQLAADAAPRLPETNSSPLDDVLDPQPLESSASTAVATSEPTAISAPGRPGRLDEAPAATPASSRPPSEGGSPIVWARFVPKSPGEALYSGVKEAVNTALGNSGLMATAAKVNGEPIDPRTFAVGALLGGGMAGARETLLRSLPVGERLGHLHQPENAPAIQRWIATTPIIWSYYSMYFTLKDAIANAIAGEMTPTELDPAHQTQAHS